MRSRLALSLAQSLAADLAAQAVQTVYGLEGMSNANGYASANGAGEQGNAVLGFVAAALVSFDSQSVASKDRWIIGTDDSTGTTYDWQVVSRTTNSTIRAGIKQTGSGATVFTSSYTIAPADLGKILLVTLEVDVVGLLMRLRVNGALVGTATVITGYAVPDTSVPFQVGKLGGTSGADGITFYGVATGHGVMTQAEIVAHQAACQAAGDIVPLSGAGLTPTHTWSPKAAVIAAGTTATAPNLADSTGSSTLTKAGTPTVRVRTNPPWA